MALETWPEQLNYLAQKGTFTEKPVDANVRTEMDAGNAIVRRRFTSVPTNLTFSVQLDDIEKLVFESFFDLTINKGADWFSMPVLVASDYVPLEVRILKDGISFTDAGFQKWFLSIQIEIRDRPNLDAVTGWLVGNYGYPDPFSDPMQKIVNNTFPHAWNGVLTV